MIDIKHLFLFGLTASVFAIPSARTQSQTERPAAIKTLDLFTGDWHCNGKFAANGKEISAKLHFEPVLDGKFVLFSHDDEPPFSYHAHAYWGWDAAAGELLSTIHDSAGGTKDIPLERLARNSFELAGRGPVGWKGSAVQVRAPCRKEIPGELFRS